MNMKGNPATAWTEEEEQALKHLLAQKMSYKDIIESLNKNPSFKRHMTMGVLQGKIRRWNDKKKNKKPNRSRPKTKTQADAAISVANDEIISGAGVHWSFAETYALYLLKTAGQKHSQIADIMNKSFQLSSREYTDKLIASKWNSTDWDSFLNTLKDHLEQKEIQEEKERIISHTISTKERLLKKQRGQAEILIENLKSAMWRVPRIKPSDVTPPKHPKKYHSEDVGVVLSDMHIGSKYTKEDTGGLGEFNLDIFKERVDKMRDGVIEIVDRHRLMYDTPTLHLFCLGDIIAGMNQVGNWSGAYIDLTACDQMIEGVAALVKMIATWANHFDNVKFYGVVGNHGRMAKRGVEKGYNNWDYLVYKLVQESMSSYENIEWNIPKTWWIQEDIAGHNFYITHGDGIRGSMGIPYYGVERAEAKIQSLLEKRPDYVLIGHFHSPTEIQTNNSRVLINGSWLGGDMYSLKDLHRNDHPEQKMFGIHGKKGITWSYNIRLT